MNDYAYCDNMDKQPTFYSPSNFIDTDETELAVKVWKSGVYDLWQCLNSGWNPVLANVHC